MCSIYSRKEIKRRAKKNLKNHYLLFVITCLIAAFIGTSYAETLDGISYMTDRDGTSAVSQVTTVGASVYDVFFNIEDGTENKKEDLSKIADDFKESQLGPIKLGRSKGVLASVVNSISSGQVFLNAYAAIHSITNSDNATLIILISIGALLLLAFWIFVVNVYQTIMVRIILEGRVYEKVHVSRFLYLVRMRKWLNVTKTMLLTSVFQMLWNLTVVGGIIKHYSYFLVPYIEAENPGIAPREAISLSKSMMYGHKKECFLIDLSFMGWNLLKLITLGFSGLFFSNSYIEATRAEYYEYLRNEARNNKIDNADKLNDEYLFHKAGEEVIKEAYKDIEEIITDINEVKPLERKGVQGFIARVFGVVVRNDEIEMAYYENEEKKLKIADYEDFITGRAYPNRLSVIPEREKRRKIETLHYMRHYSITSLILIFFSASLVGWLWEVCIHLVEDGVFVNRGVSHGPWLPIYGAGAILIVTLLNKFRKSPLLEFILAVILCGVVEYMTSVYLETVHHGMKWWDYSGYFLNINGRVCAEGLLVFGIGGIFAVYVLAPTLDNIFRKINRKVAIVICLVLSLLFVGDQIYSRYYPNNGKGITDYDNNVSCADIFNGKLLDSEEYNKMDDVYYREI